MSRLVKKQPARCTDLPLDNPDIYGKLCILRELLKSSYGPNGRLKQIHNNIGGHVVTTSTSTVLLPALSSSAPFINLIRTSVINHTFRLSDCGLFTAILCLCLIEQAQLSGLRKTVCQRVYKHLLEVCTAYLQQEDCLCRVKVDFSSSQILIRLAYSVISSKPACVLREAEVLHISTLTVHGFLRTVPCTNPGVAQLGRITTVPVEGLPVLDSAVFPGLLLNTSDSQTELCRGGPLRTVVFSESLAGDISELEEGTLELHRGVNLESQIQEKLLKLGAQVVKDDVRLFMCQKVIHPVLQQYLRAHGIAVAERLGINLLEPVIHLTGAQPVATLHAPIPSQAYGKVKEISVKMFGSKTMLHLLPTEEKTICTMVLCHRNESMLNELKMTFEKAEHILRLTLKDPFVLFGGGCTETHLAAYIRNKSSKTPSDTASALGCSQTEFWRAADGFSRSLEAVAAALEHDGGGSVMDLTHAHHWTLPAGATTDGADLSSSGSCGCGLLQDGRDLQWSFINSEHPRFCPAGGHGEARVLDSFTAKVNGLQVAVETAALALDIQYVIQDTN